MTLRRRTPLRRTSIRRRPAAAEQPPIKLRRRPTSYARRPRDFDYMGMVKTLPCLLAGVDGAGDCSGPIEADHAGLDRGLSHKADDSTCIPLCQHHHIQRTETKGWFAALSKEERRRWRAWAIAATTMRVAERRAGLR